MLRVTIEMLKYGNEKDVAHLGTATIANDVTGTKSKGNYTISLSQWGQPKKTWRRGRIEGFDRLKQGPWDLLLYALRAALTTRESENVKTSFVPFVEEPAWETVSQGFDWVVVGHDGKSYWANQEPTVINGIWTVREEDGGRFLRGSFVELPLGVDYRICKWSRPSPELKERIEKLRKFGR